jgi:hypothetical protein
MGAQLATTLWSSVATLKSYDMVILSCECEEHLVNKGNGAGNAFDAVAQYLDAGGRIFTTDFMYTWYSYSPDSKFKSAASFRGQAPVAGSPMTIDTGFPKGQALKEWTDLVVPGSNGQINPDVVFGNIASLDGTKAQEWAQSGAGVQAPAGPRVFTVNMPAGVPPEQQCGKGVHIDAHLNQTGTDQIDTTYPKSCNEPLKPGEKLLAFFFFDLAACIQNDAAPPKPPNVVH